MYGAFMCARETTLPASTATKRDTKTAIMDTAEIMMAEHGLKGVSIRAILSEAGANSAALHYHFNSREGLIKAMMGRYDRIPRRRKELIAEFEARSIVPTAEDIVDLLVDPMIELLVEEGEDGRRSIRFIARLQSDRAGVHLAEEDKYFPEVRERLGALLKQACPDVSASELRMRITMVIDAMLQSLANAEFMTKEWDDEGHRNDLARFSATLKTFLAGGLAAAAT